MPQKWYETIDDYVIALTRANFYGPASTLSLRQYAVRAGLSNPYTGMMLVSANLIALTALVALDPAGLRSKGKRPGLIEEIKNKPQLQAEIMDVAQHVKEFIGWKPTQQALVKDDEGFIEVV